MQHKHWRENMRWKHHAIVAIATLTGIALLAGHPAQAATPAQRPNFVVFLSDDHGYLDSTPYGATDVRTPSMARLANAGMRFTHAFIASPACAPSRAALMTGLMPARNGAEANHTQPRAGLKTFPAHLQKCGYEVAAFQQQCRAVGGDLYDVALLPNGHLVVMVADVSGKGMGAALLMANILSHHEPRRNV